ncbi:unnamed protein product [Cylindrotheca closterium]|uniref:Calmodulin n=1 Tax=Cylindrotheca closterium TaxID=2856 RepID=A0AAD2FXG7_9STRA|nr:unnamed protein product [Cylindrotheca closterium]
MNSSWKSLCLLGFLIASLEVPIEAFSTSSQTSPIRDQSDRRSFVTQTLGGIVSGAGILTSSPSPSFAYDTARVQKWPGVEYLEPFCEFQLAIQAVAIAAEDESKYPLIKKRLEQFFKGAVMSERNLYAGIALTYTNKIKYDPQELPNYVQLDQQERFNLVEDTMINLKNLMVSIPATPTATYNKQDILDYANGATVSLKRWFALIPKEDVDKAMKLFMVSRFADANKDGRVDLEESEAIPEEYRELWKKRLGFIGALTI